MSRLLTVRSAANVLIALIALALLGGLALAVTDDDTVSFTNTAQEDQPQEPGEEGGAEGQGRPARHCRGHAGPLRHAIHGELLVPERPEEGAEGEGEEGEEGEGEGDAVSFETIVIDAGRVLEASDDSLSLERPDGERVTVRITEETRRRDEAVEVGDTVRVVADTDGNARVVLVKPEPDEGSEGEARGEGVGRCRPGPRGPRGGGESPENSAPEV